MATTDTPGDLQLTKVRGMPSKSPAQKRLMAGVAHDPAFAAKVGIPQSVGREFNEADKAKAKGKKPKESWRNKLGD